MSKELVRVHEAVLVNEESEKLRNEMKALINLVEQAWYKFSTNIVEIYDNKKYIEWGYDSFEDYVEQDLGIPYRIANWKLNAGKKILLLGITEKEVDKIGYTKFKEVASIMKASMSKDEISDLLNKARTTSLREIQQYVKAIRLSQQGDGKRMPLQAVKFKFTIDQLEVLGLGISVAKETVETTFDEVALEYIIRDWLLHTTGGTKDDRVIMSEYYDDKVAHKTHINKEKE